MRHPLGRRGLPSSLSRSVELSDPCDSMACMTDDFAQDVHDLLAEIRGVATSLTVGGPDAFVRNFELGVGAFARGPEHAVGIAAMMSVRRFEQLNEARVGSGSEPIAFPKTVLLDRFPVRKGVVPDCLTLIGHLIDHGMTDAEPVRELVRGHGVPGFMMLVQIYNELGKMLVDVDPDLDSLPDLMTREALADERDWFSGDV